MQVYLIRHTTPAIAKGICYGQTDIGLNETLFEQEIKIIQSKLSDEIEQFYTSPLVRCKSLAEKLSPNCIVDGRLMELNFGNWENEKWNELDQADLNLWMGDFVNIKTPNGENYLDLHRRTKQFIAMALKTSSKKIAIVTHAGNIRSFISFTLGLPLKNSFKIQLGYASVVVLTLNQDKYLNQFNLLL